MIITNNTGIPPGNFVYERRASTIAEPVPGLATGYRLLHFRKPRDRDKLLVYSVGTDQHLGSVYTWKIDGVELPISGEARVGSIENPFVFPEPLIVTDSIELYIDNTNAVEYPRVDSSDPDAEYSYECVICGRYI
jgi:hypothetical protein